MELNTLLKTSDNTEGKMYSRVYASINLNAIDNNFSEIKRNISDTTKVIAVIKTDGYGHGAVEIAKETEDLDYIWGFATATVEEALILRRHHISKPILILGYSFREQFVSIVENNIRPAIFNFEDAKLLSDEAAKLNKTVKIHIKVDSGMRRIGYQLNEESIDEVVIISKLPNLLIEGIFTHFSKADETDKSYTKHQISVFNKFNELLSVKGLDIPLKHCSNSAGIIDIKEANMNLVRAGIIIYGLWPSDEVLKKRINLKPVLELKSKVVHVKELDADNLISYGGTFKTEKVMRIATVSIGYGDGYPRSLSNKGYVLINGKKAGICGRICMDQMMVDVTDIDNVNIGDTVTLIGKDGDEVITMEQIGDLSGRFNYEFACDLGKRIPRIFIKDNKIVSTKDYFDE